MTINFHQASPSFGWFATGGAPGVFNFTAGSLPANTTFQRASAGTDYNSAGVLTTYGTDVARYGYNPSTLAYRGIFNEPAATNLHLYSNTYTNAYWIKTNLTVSGTTESGIDGTNSAYRVTASAGTNTKSITTTNTSITSGQSYTVSFVIKYTNHAFFQIPFAGSGFSGSLRANFNIQTATIGDLSAGVTARITPLSNGFIRIEATAVSTASVGQPIAYLWMVDSSSSAYAQSITTSGTESFLLTYSQSEIGTYATSIITTNASTVTRATDILTLTLPYAYNRLIVTFDDNSTQTINSVTSPYVVPTNLNRDHIKKIEALVDAPIAIHDASFSTETGAVGDLLTVVPNVGSNGTDFTFISTREFNVGQRYGKKTGLATSQDAMNLPTYIPIGSDYTIFVAFQVDNLSGNLQFFTQYKTSVIDIFHTISAVRHNGIAVPANGYNFTNSANLGLQTLAWVYKLSTGTVDTYINGQLAASGAVPLRSGTVDSAVFNNLSGSLSPTSGINGNYLGAKVWHTALDAAQVAVVSNSFTSSYATPYNRYIPTTAQKGYAFYGDSMFNTPDSANSVPNKFAVLYTPNSDVQARGVNGNTSTQVKTRFDTLPQYRNQPTAFWCGRNDPSVPATVISNIQGMVNQLDNPSNCIVMLTTWNTTEFAAGPGNAGYDTIATLRAAQVAAFGSLTLDANDITQANNYDGLHPNSAGSILIAQRIKDRFDSMGL